MTKGEVISMLTDIQSEIEENVLADDPNTLLLFLQARETCVAIIQQKINALKAEEAIQDYESKQLIDELSKMPLMAIETASINRTLYGENVTEKWLTAAQNASALEKAYRKGYYEALQKMREEKEEVEE